MSYMLIQMATAYERARHGVGTWMRVGRTRCGRQVLRYMWPLTLLLLTACATQPRVVALKPPPELAQEVQEPQLAESPDNGDLARWADELRAALREANRRLRALHDL